MTGNLNWRQNNKYSDLKETFNYDNLDRLDNVYLGAGAPVLTLDMAYDSNKGGITTKSDTGTMIYNYPNNPYALGGICPTTGLVPQNMQSVTCTSFESVSTISENNYQGNAAGFAWGALIYGYEKTGDKPAFNFNGFIAYICN